MGRIALFHWRTDHCLRDNIIFVIVTPLAASWGLFETNTFTHDSLPLCTHSDGEDCPAKKNASKAEIGIPSKFKLWPLLRSEEELCEWECHKPKTANRVYHSVSAEAFFLKLSSKIFTGSSHSAPKLVRALSYKAVKRLAKTAYCSPVKKTANRSVQTDFLKGCTVGS